MNIQEIGTWIILGLAVVVLVWPRGKLPPKNPASGPTGSASAAPIIDLEALAKMALQQAAERISQRIVSSHADQHVERLVEATKNFEVK